MADSNSNADRPDGDGVAPGERRLYEALRLFAESPDAKSRERLIAEHPELAEELAPLIHPEGAVPPAIETTEDDESGVFAAGTVIADYRLAKRLGVGGMGVVYEAEQISLKRRVALKLMPSRRAASPRRRARFRREAEAGGRVQHKNIVAVYAVGEQNGIPFIAQELVEGGRTLAHWIAERRKRGAPDAEWERRIARFFALAAHAVQAAHDAGVVHRDLKPRNLLVGAEDEPKVADFGLAWMHAEIDISQSGDQIGTPHYMSPEQIDPRLGEVDERSDVFSLGAALYEALTLVKPFDGELPAQVYQQVLNEDVEDPRDHVPPLSRDLVAICLKALEKRPLRRYATMRAFADDLKAFLRDEPVTARPPTALDRLARAVRRHALPLLVVVLVLVAIALAVLASRQSARHAVDLTQERTETNRLIVDGLFDPDVLRASDRFVDVVTKVKGRVAEKLSDDPALAAQLLEAVGIAALAREESPADRVLARDSLSGAAEKLKGNDRIAAALLALRAERLSQEAGDRQDAAALRAAWIPALARSNEPGERLVHRLFRAEELLAGMREGREVEESRRKLEELAKDLSDDDPPQRLRRAALEVAATIAGELERHADAAEGYAELLRSQREGSPDGGVERVGLEYAGALDRIEWRSRRALALARAGDLANAHRLIEDCLADRQQMFGADSAGYLADQVRAAYVRFARGDILGLAPALEPVLSRLEQLGRGESEDVLLGRTLLADARIESAKRGARPDTFNLGLARIALQGALDLSRKVRGAQHPDVVALERRLAHLESEIGESR